METCPWCAGLSLNEDDGSLPLAELWSVINNYSTVPSHKLGKQGHKKPHWVNFTSLFLLGGEAAPNIRCGDVGIGRVVWCSGGQVWGAGSWALCPAVRHVQEICLGWELTRSTKGQLLLLQELDLLFQLMLPLLLLVDTLWERTSVKIWQSRHAREPYSYWGATSKSWEPNSPALSLPTRQAGECSLTISISFWTSIAKMRYHMAWFKKLLLGWPGVFKSKKDKGFDPKPGKPDSGSGEEERSEANSAKIMSKKSNT